MGRYSFTDGRHMSSTTSGLTVKAQVQLLTPDRGGRTQPVISGYRPLCFIDGEDGYRAIIGLCELRLTRVPALQPGESGDGTLIFLPSVADEARAALTVGSTISLGEGTRIIGFAQVVEVT